MELRDLPTLNALLNTICAALLVSGYRLIRRGEREKHRRVMLMAVTVAAMFLLSYLVYHFNAGSVKFQKQGAIRTVYFAILISHTLLAAAVAPMAIIVLYRALKGDFARHRKLARITLPLWLYVSVTGVVVYLMLYRM
jgi:uncharacterized membrane protein YozB (DUF420 family)